MVREYLELEYKMLWKNVKHLTYDIERIIDDFLLICCFIGNFVLLQKSWDTNLILFLLFCSETTTGNDFLPRLYCFNIREG